MYLPSACILTILLAGLIYVAIRLRIPPKVLAILSVLVFTALGVATWQRAGTYRTAVSLWSDNVIKDPASTKAWINLGYSFYEEGNFQGVARAADSRWQFGLAFDDSWSRANALHMSSWVAIDQGEFAQAEELLRKTLAEYPTSEGKIDLGQALIKQEKWHEAKIPLQEVLEVWPENFSALILYAEALVKSGELENWRRGGRLSTGQRS